MSRAAPDTRPLHELTVAEARLREAAAISPQPTDNGRVAVDDLDGPVPIRLYRPRLDGLVPVCVWLPGGGWVLDTLPASDAVLRTLATEAGCALAAVRYRLAPEHPFPVPLEDGLDAIRRLVARATDLGLDSSLIAIGGTSAGANLAAAATLALRDRGGPSLAAQILVYPPLLHGSATASTTRSGDAATLDERGVAWCWSHYLSDDADGADPYASPLRAPTLAGLPPALVLTAEHDPLRDEGELYAERLRQAGVEVEAIRVAGASHGFFAGDGELARQAQRAVVGTLRRRLGTAGDRAGECA